MSDHDGDAGLVAGEVGQEVRLPWWHPLDDGFRDGVSTVAASILVLAADVMADLGASLALYLLVYWDLMAVLYVLLTLLALRSSPRQLHRWAQDRSRPVGWLRKALGGGPETLSQLPSLAAVVGLAASAYVLPRVDDLARERATLLTVACVVAVLGGWLVTHLSFVLQYAFLYYHSDPPGGLEFPGTSRPGTLEFAYFAAAVGTTFGTTDVTVVRGDLRKAVLTHGLVAFLFNTAVLALTLTLLFS